MAKSYAQAQADALAAGVPLEYCTPQVVMQFGWEPADPTAGVVYTPAQTPEKLATGLAALAEEARANSLPAWVLNTILSAFAMVKGAGVLGGKTAGPAAGVILICALLFLGGCASQQAQNATDQTALAVINLHKNHCAFEDKFLAANYAANVADAQAKSLAALASVTRIEPYIEKVPRTMVNGVVTEWTDVQKTREIADPATVAALVAQKVRLLQACDKTLADEKLQQAQIGVDAANALACLTGLRDWFAGRAATQKAWADAQAALMAALDKWLAPAAKPKP